MNRTKKRLIIGLIAALQGDAKQSTLFNYPPIKGAFRVVVYAEYREVGNEIIAFVPCERCGAIIGRLTVEEVAALSTGKYGKVLCFDCEDSSCGVCQKELTELEVIENHTRLVNGAYVRVCWFCAQEDIFEKAKKITEKGK